MFYLKYVHAKLQNILMHLFQFNCDNIIAMILLPCLFGDREM